MCILVTAYVCALVYLCINSPIHFDGCVKSASLEGAKVDRMKVRAVYLLVSRRSSLCKHFMIMIKEAFSSFLYICI
jgi:hypothetical protein